MRKTEITLEGLRIKRAIYVRVVERESKNRRIREEREYFGLTNLSFWREI